MEFFNKIRMLFISLFVFLILMAISCPSESTGTLLNRIVFILYTRDNKYTGNHVNEKSDLENFKSFNSTHETIAFIDEYYNCTSKYEIDTALKNAYLAKDAYNFIVVAWLHHKNFYGSPTYIHEEIGESVAEFFYEMHKKGMISLSQLHIIAFGRGAQIAANVSIILQKLEAPKIGRITGLDPVDIEAHEPMGEMIYLNKSSATYVDIISTTSSSLKEGEPRSRGHVEFSIDVEWHRRHCGNHKCCKHILACFYYIKSVKYPHSYSARRCNYHNRHPICTKVAGQYLGIASNSSMPGLFNISNMTIPTFV